MSRSSRPTTRPIARPARTVTGVLGPTNTGKTHLAIERMLAHDSGLIGLPLRLLAREVYDKVVARAGASHVALITGEEKIKPKYPRYFICTVEAMPLEEEVDFLAIDEIQLATDAERGHVFTDRLLQARGNSETLLLGAATMRKLISTLLPGTNTVSRSRLSKLTYAGHKKLSRLPRRTAIVAFSASDVYAIAELIRRQRGGAAVVMGALSPRTRNAQVELYQSGEVDFLVATDAIGMGLNLDVDHVAFAATRKFDGQNHRQLTPTELAQIAGRAGRHMNDGTFGVTASVEPLETDLVYALENHTFEDERVLQWRNRALEFDSIEHLKASLQLAPEGTHLVRNRMVEDQIALENASMDPDVRRLASSPAAIRRLWEVCQIPDYQKISSQSHAELAMTLYRHLMSDEGVVPEDWFAQQVDSAASTEGDIDTLANRIAHVRTWTFVSHRADWLANAPHWQERTREIEDSLSDALHERLTRRFVDRRTSVLMRRLRDKEDLHAEIADDGAIQVERHFIGRLQGFRFSADTTDRGIHGKAARSAASKVLAVELSKRADELVAADDDAFSLGTAYAIEWQGNQVARLVAGEAPLQPAIQLLVDDNMPPGDREQVSERLQRWLDGHIATHLGPLVQLTGASDVTGLARGVAFQLAENFGVLRREAVSNDIRALDQDARGQLRKYGVRFGAFNIYFPQLLKPAATDIRLLLWALRNGEAAGLDLAHLPEPPRQGLTSAQTDSKIGEDYYRVAGFHVCGARIVRIDMLERLADMIRPLVSWRPNDETPEAPPGATGNGGFRVVPDMMSIVGCSGEEFASVLTALGFQRTRISAAKADDAATGEKAAAESSAAGDGVKAPEGAETPEDAAAAAAQIDEIWRPRRQQKPAHHGRAKSRNKGPAPDARAKPGKGGKFGKGRSRPAAKSAKSSARPRQRPAKIDPDSPFAVLGQLKDNMKQDTGEKV